MFVYVGKSFTSTQTGKRTIKVHCDQCKTEYFFDLVRQGAGKSSAPYYIAQNSARRRAEKAATKALQKKLAQDSELVPCPDCHWINDQLVAGYRKMRLRWIGNTCAVLSVIAFIVSFLIWSMQQDRKFEETWYLNLIYSALAVLPIIGAAWLLHKMFASRINPNKNFPNPPRLLPGTPRGWTAAQLLAPNPVDDGRYVPPAEADEIYPGWAVFRAGQLQFSPVCCECLAPATDRYKDFLPVNNRSSLQPPICKECKSRLRLGWFLAAMGSILGAFGIAFIGAMVLISRSSDRIAFEFVVGFVLAIVGLAVFPNYFIKPFALRTVDRDRAIFRIWFRNEQYMELVRDAARKIEEQSIRRPVITQVLR